ncbi:MAG: Calx-beta domain-containing protein, partial [Chloroflexota bacterium]
MKKIKPSVISIFSLLFALICANYGAVSAQSTPNLIITEIMFNPSSSEPAWEWIEIYNAGSSTADLSGFVIDDNNDSAHASANISAGTISPGGAAILFNADSITASDFEAAWGTVNLIGVTNWSDMQLNNAFDVIGIWESFADYNGDHQDQLNTIFQIRYFSFIDDWPTTNNSASFYLTSLTADPATDENWELSSIGGNTPLNTGYQSAAAGGNSGQDVGSPGTPIPETEFSISSGSIAEGDSGTTTLNFTVTRSDNVTDDSVQFSSSDGTATAGEDYMAVADLEVLFSAGGNLDQIVSISVQGDTDFESDETVIGQISSAVGGTIATPSATGTIENDDEEPIVVDATLSLSEAVSQAEGDSGTTNFEFSVALDSAVPEGFTLAYTVSDGTATAGEDYTDNDGTLTFDGDVDEVKTIIVEVTGDADFEPDETFTVELGEIGSTDFAADINIPVTSRTGTIENDDEEPIVVDATLSLSEA